MELTYKFRIYPNEEQERQIKKTFGCTRFIYNRFLEQRRDAWDNERRSVTRFEQDKQLPELKKEYPWLAEADSAALQFTVKDLDTAFKNFLGKKAKYPKFKKKSDSGQSYRTRGCIHVKEKTVRLPKLGDVKCCVSRPVEGRILSATVSATPDNRYFVSLCCTDVPERKLEEAGKSVGIDLGIKALVTDSDGNVYENGKYLAKSEQRLKLLQQQLSRKQKGSANREKARIRLARQYRRVHDQRLDAIHKTTAKIVKENDIVCTEDLAAKDMLTNHKLAKSLSDASFGEISRQLDYKCRIYGRELVKVGRFYPSSQICSCCGYKNEAVKDLSVRTWTCPNCNTVHDRDRNAAENIKSEGLRIVSGKQKIEVA